MTDIDYIMKRIEIMRYRWWALRLEPSSCGYRKPKFCDGSFKPTDRNSKSWNCVKKTRKLSRWSSVDSLSLLTEVLQ